MDSHPRPRAACATHLEGRILERFAIFLHALLAHSRLPAAGAVPFLDVDAIVAAAGVAVPV